MPSNLTPELPQNIRRGGFEESVLQRKGLNLDAGAPVTGAVSVGAYIVAGFGDGNLRFFHFDAPPITIRAHGGAILSCIGIRNQRCPTGGDDGRFARLA